MNSERVIQSLKDFHFERVLREDALDGSIVLLGSLNDQRTIVSLQKTAFDVAQAAIITQTFARLQSLGYNDVYNWALGWFASEGADAQVKVNVIHPASDVHIKLRKYTQQRVRMVRETPELYASVVEPYINSFDISRIQWVYNILDHITEAERIVYEDTDPQTGFLIIPDLKWDQKTMSALYVQTIVRNRSIRSMRDLRAKHLPLLRKINAEGRKAVAAKYGVNEDELRLFVHYQPSYYHLHVHMLHVDLRGYAGSTTGQSTLLADIIDNLELDVAREKATGVASAYYAERTFTYALGEQHGLYAGLTQSR